MTSAPDPAKSPVDTAKSPVDTAKSAVDTGKSTVDKAKAAFAAAREKWPAVEHLVQTVERYNDRRGNVYAAAISFNGILALVPIIMVVFSVAAFVLANQPQLLEDLQKAVVEAAPGKMGEQLSEVIDSAISSRAAVGIVGLIGAAFTGIGWISGVRVAFTEMYGGRVDRNPVLSKVWDLLTFALLGIAFAVTMALTTLGNSGLTTTMLSWVGLDDASWAPVVVRAVAILVSVVASWLLFTFVLARLPLVPLPMTHAMKAGLIIAIAFELMKSLGGLYLQSVLSSPAGVAFGPILGVFVFAYLASRIVLYATAWCATDPINSSYQVVEEPDAELRRPVVISPTVEVNPAPRAGVLAAAAGAGAAVAALVGILRRR
ncbi:YhjD/YihY/BrkB family envelope integrity protein [Gordonia terrae]|uniref:Inner membrane protein YhjD n=2 Tax=Gordonia terrae TaxID=2055 RepID=A0AAD0K6H7_9ACTN|nr:YhjD/YihY/BrkB family envelope integrity protein [Gordonia terrae]VTR07433.1 Inner membrane protein yhjD [Clostridioides difficile]ANY22943.1 inner membrane protein YhjD [Gordonia terrae]AWO83675.1 inner membrane protein YhjD [Gordonia terrae]VTS45069.1 Inner membrane protein yhjD [Gordonia terrae]GAB44830.1 putative ribonuclease [Gordonia terrae NBRC 100016]